MAEKSPEALVSIRSLVPGRGRWDVPSCLDRPERAARIERLLSGQTAVSCVKANPATGRVLIEYDPSVNAQDVEAHLQQAVARAASEETTFSRAALNAESTGASLERILQLTKGHHRAAAMAVGVAIIDRMFEAAPSAMIGAAGDIVTKRSDSFFGRLGFRTIDSQLLALGGSSLVVWVLDSLMNYVHAVTSASLARDVQHDLRNRAYRQLQTLDIAQLERRPVNEWISLVRSDTGRIAHFLEEGVDPFVMMLTNAVTVALTFLVNSPALAAAQLLVLPGLYLVSTRMLRPLRERQEAAREEEDRLNAAVLGNVTGMSTIKSFGRETAEAERIDTLGESSMEGARHAIALGAGYVPAIQMVVATGFVATLLWGGRLVNRGKLSIALYNVMGFSTLRLFNSLARLGISIEQFQRTRVSFDRLNRLFEMHPLIESGERRLPAARVRGDLRIENVTFRYEPGRPALNGISLHIPAGKTTAIVGATGAGKTTLQKLMLRFFEPESGRVMLDGTDIREFRVDDLRAAFATVPQQTFLFDGTVRENIAYARPDASLEEITRAAQAAQADGFIREMRGGYDASVGENGNKLSGGQKQRVTIARALLANRPILLFDEATSAIDYETEAAMQESLQSMIADRTTVIVAHRLSTIRHADNIYVLEEGKVCEQGTHDELIRKNGMYASVWRIQTGEARRGRKSGDSGESVAVAKKAVRKPATAKAPKKSATKRSKPSPSRK